MEGATGTLGTTAAGAVCATGAACGGFVQPSCPTQFAIICLVSGDQPSSGAFAANICLAASPYDCQAKVAPTPIQIASRKRANPPEPRLFIRFSIAPRRSQIDLRSKASKLRRGVNQE